MLSKKMKVLSMVMSVIVMIMSLPLAGYATLVDSADETDNTAVTESQAETATEGEAYVIGEDVSKREESVKYFRMSDGSYTACVYNYPVHYEKDGEMVEIDNTVIPSDANNGYYEITDSPVEILLPNEYSEDTPVVYTSGEHSISFVFDVDDSVKEIKKTAEEKAEMKSLKAANKERKKELKEAILTEYLSDEEYKEYFKKAKEEMKLSEKELKAAIKEFNELSMNVPNANSALSYENITDNVSIEYIVQGTTLKENIVISKPISAKTFKFIIKSDTLTPVLQEDNSVIFVDEKENTVMKIAAPFMYDAMGATTDDITVKLKNKNGYYEYSLTPDKKWMKDEKRVYPITIDPPVQVGSFSTVKDTTAVFNGAFGNLDDGSEPCYLKVGLRYNSGTGTIQEVQGMLYCALPSQITSNSRIISAQLGIRGYATSALSTCPYGITIGAYRITSDWNTADIMENGLIQLGDAGNADYYTLIDYATVNDSNASTYHGSAVWFDITSAAQKWADGEAPNYGIALRTLAHGATENFARFYDSTNTAQAGACPQFYFAYRDTKGIEGYWTYTSMPAGKYGTIAVNNFNGNLVVTQNAVTTSGNYMPVSVSYIYNMCDNGTASIGKWQTNYNMQIKTCNITHGSLHYDYYLVDDDGTEHYFYKTDDNTYKDEDGLGLVLSDSVNVYKYGITDKQDNKWYFHANGNLERISDKKGNFNDIFYNSNGTISYINEGNFANPGHNRQTRFEYSGEKVTITAPDGYKTEVYFNNSTLSRIESIKYYFGNQLLYTTSISYNDDGNVKSVYDGLGRTANIVYTTSVPKRVGFISYDTSSVTLERYDFDYKHNLTYIKDFKNRTVMYHFNNFGHTVGVTDFASSRGITYEYGVLNRTIQNEELSDSLNQEKNKLLASSRVISPSVNYIPDGAFKNTSDFTWDLAPSSASSTFSCTHTTSFGHNDSTSMYLNKSVSSADSSVTRQISGLSVGTYTLSAYVNTKSADISGKGYTLLANVYNSSTIVSSNQSSAITQTGADNNWMRVSATFDITASGQYVLLGVYATANTAGEIWIDDIQLERADGAGSFNLLDDTWFYPNTSAWSGYGYAAYTASDTTKPKCIDRWFQVDGVYNADRTLKQTINISGSKGDIYSFGAWAKATALSPSFTSQYRAGDPTFSANLTFYNGSTKVGNTVTVEYNYAMSEWQYAHDVAAATGAYTKIVFEIKYSYNANRAYFAAPFVYKENYGETYTYDSGGNLVSAVDLAETESNFAYADNYLINSISPSGANYSYYYDRDNMNVEYSVSSNNQMIDLSYDNTNKATDMTVSGFKRASTIEEGKEYYILSYETSRALSYFSNGRVATAAWNFADGLQKWKFELSSGNIYKIYLSEDAAAKRYLYTSDSSTHKLSTSPSGSTGLYKCVVNSQTGNIIIKTGESNYYFALYDEASVRDEDANFGATLSTTYSQGFNEEKWFLVEVEEDRKYMSASVTYTNDGNHVATSTDTRGIVSEYNYTSAGNLLKETVKENGTAVLTTDYLYSAKNQLTQVTSENTTVKYQYTNSDPGLLTKIETPSGTSYSFVYDIFGRTTQTKVGTRPLSENTYTGNLLTKQEYGNEDFVEFAYDNLDRLYQKKYNGVTKVEYAYNANGEIASMIDYFANKQQFYTYDLSGRLTEAYTENINTGSLYTHTIYDYIDAKNLLGGKTVYLYAGETAPQKTLAETYTYGNQAAGEIPDAIYGVSLNGEDILSYEYDSLGRLTRRRYDKPGISARYVYEEDLMDWNKTNNLVFSYTTRGLCYEYEYDALGNITYVTTAGNVYEYYAYDDLSRLTRVNVNYDSLAEAQGLDSIDAPDNYTTAYTYDAGGNILTKKIYSHYGSGVSLADKTPLDTITYTYGDSVWKDLLTNYNGTAITYDEIGNPLNWRDGMTFTWENGRQLKSVTTNGRTYTYKYNADGMRIRKNGNGLYEYIYDESGRLVAINNNGYLDTTYMYDENGSPIGMQVGTTNYWFVKNLQGDVIEIVNDSGETKAKYYYDEWGVPTAVYANYPTQISFEKRSIILYRGYVYDWETGLYYLNSRYYDPVVGRFINADAVVADVGGDIRGYNMFSYCFNNPIMYVDYTGDWPEWGLFTRGTLAASIGFSAVAVVLSIGVVCSPFVALGLALLGTAGMVVATTGVYDVVESFTGTNPYKEDFGEDAYYTAQNIGVTVISVGYSIMTEIGTPQSVCFVAGTLIATEDGKIPIEEITEDKYVFATNPETGGTDLKRVVQTFKNETTELVHLLVNGERITTTPKHPFWVPQKGWTEAANLSAGDKLQLLNGEYVVLEVVQHEILETPVTVYNFEVEDFHTYYVSDIEILVHNHCGPNGIYEKAPYHNKGNSWKSAAPIDGQTALDNSFLLNSNTTRRIGISEGQFVVLDQTSEGIYHGHVRTWDDLTALMRVVLIREGKVTRKGKIL